MLTTCFTPDGLIELAIIVMLARTSTVLLECRNAHVNRWARCMATQSVPPLLRNLASNFVLQKLSRRKNFEQAMYSRVHGRTEAAKQQRRRKVRKPATTKKGGGPWRAFISSRCRGVCKALFAALSQQYRDLTQEERHALGVTGTFATAKHRQGGLSFGKATRDMAREAVKSKKHRRALQLAGLGDTARTPEQALRVPLDDIGEEVKRLKGDHWCLRRVDRDVVAEGDASLLHWRRTKGISDRDKAMVANPEIARHASTLIGAPTAKTRTLCCWIGSARLLCNYREW